MLKALISKFVHVLCVLLGITLISFVLANLSPVDPAEAYAKRHYKGAGEERIAEVRKELGFDKSVPEQYLSWLQRAVRLDFGESYLTHKPVMREMAGALPTTLNIAILAAVLILLFSVPLGILAAEREGRLADFLISGFAFLSLSIPGYFLGLLCVFLFGFQLRLFPVIGHGHPLSLMFAALVLAFPMIGSLAKMLRTLLLEYRQRDFVTYALARGISKRRIMWHHLLRNAAAPCVTMFGQNIGYLIAGTAVVETIFSCAGIGTYALHGALNRDFPVITAYILIMALFFVLCNLGADLAGMLLNPKTRKAQENRI
ncbi:ABC transporter permease [Desulfitobacterium chlororespirans]|uniref:ABC transporter permease n=1 Tax=Desulfitobacterium chlororespirans TaxID=51616 RepID=UPI0009322B7B|nr:ABC transporter permease [Desulfitobacterium chlororespirans]